jgi:S1-C subfamily serine protease
MSTVKYPFNNRKFRENSEMTNILQQLNSEMASVVTEVQRSLVQISDGRGGAGAGTIWHSDGLIVTNAHVVARGPVTVTLADGREFSAGLLARDTDRDLAALSIEAQGLPTIEPGNSRKLQSGQWVFAIGHPWGIKAAVTAGTVIGIGSQWPGMPMQGQDWIVVSLAVRPGNSGGPLVDVYGRLVGINTIMTGPEVGAAIPAHTIKAFLKEALTTEPSVSAQAVPVSTNTRII